MSEENIIKNLKQGDHIEFMWHGSSLIYTGRIETRDGDSELYFVNEHCYNGDSINPKDENMRFYNPLESFGVLTYLKVFKMSEQDLSDRRSHITLHPKHEDNGKTQRASGHYWVLTGSANPWMVAHWSLNDGYWLYPGRERPHLDSYFKAIDERPIVRE